MLELTNVNISYGAINAVHNVSMQVKDGEIVSLIGANGAGKTTILHTITGLKKATSGTISYNGVDLQKTEASNIVTHGIAHVPEGRALMSKPKILLMDEPSMGLSPLLVKEIFSIVKEVHKQGITVLLVEQNAKMALAIADRAYVLETGRIAMSGDAKELLKDEKVKRAYLGL